MKKSASSTPKMDSRTPVHENPNTQHHFAGNPTNISMEDSHKSGGKPTARNSPKIPPNFGPTFSPSISTAPSEEDMKTAHTHNEDNDYNPLTPLPKPPTSGTIHSILEYIATNFKDSLNLLPTKFLALYMDKLGLQDIESFCFWLYKSPMNMYAETYPDWNLFRATVIETKLICDFIYEWDADIDNDPTSTRTFLDYLTYKEGLYEFTAAQYPAKVRPGTSFFSLFDKLGCSPRSQKSHSPRDQNRPPDRRHGQNAHRRDSTDDFRQADRQTFVNNRTSTQPPNLMPNGNRFGHVPPQRTSTRGNGHFDSRGRSYDCSYYDKYDDNPDPYTPEDYGQRNNGYRPNFPSRPGYSQTPKHSKHTPLPKSI